MQYQIRRRVDSVVERDDQEEQQVVDLLDQAAAPRLIEQGALGELGPAGLVVLQHEERPQGPAQRGDRPARVVPLAAVFNAAVYGRTPTPAQIESLRSSLNPIAP